MKHFIIVAVLVIASTVLVYFGLTSIGLLPVEASSQAASIDRLFNTHLMLISFLLSLIVVFIVYSIVVFRRKPGDTGDGKHIEGNSGLEIVWTVIPLGFVLYFAFLGSRSLTEIRRVDPQAMVVNITAGQWYWSFEYPAYNIVSKSLNLPVNKQVLFKMTSKDVIHSFWVPEFRVKQDILPGENLVKDLRVTPSLIGNYKVRCAELCGGSHAYMEAAVIVQSQEEFDAWVSQQLAAISSDPATRGEVWSGKCVACHSIDGSKGVGPTWKGLFNHRVELADGSMVIADEEYLKLSIIDPSSQVVKGYQDGLMPGNYSKLFTDQQVLDLVEFIKALK